ncbi:hypothetical protein DM794_01655 [Paenarthrobacter ureafaciens]|uniref:DUF6308 family protein n=1 Tax=Paenarthrobacter ureafaciens TaxID=37931 RepID=UPI0015BE848C|nr:DUF6308 family protein [Paenarthrobacter ureafaciens]NWL25779.1 hypothetical protein [Paenarthrobacter ureafaciens]
MTTLTVGGLTVPLDVAQGWAGEYLVDNPGRSAYPAYDAYPGSCTGEIGRQDLLAIVLLNVSDQPVATYYALESLIEPLNVLLSSPDITGTLDVAKPATLDAVAKLFSVLDKDRPKGVRMTKVSKVIARKRPGLIPVFDRFVRHCYTGCANAPVPSVDGRTWEAYSRSWLEAVQHDLRSQLTHWEDLASIAPGPKISPLRALDIIAWRAGQGGFSRRTTAVESAQ